MIRGFVGFAADGRTKTAYNDSRSGPRGLGLAVLAYARSITDPLRVRAQVRRLRVAGTGTAPAPRDVRELERWTRLGEHGRADRPSWYELLRGTGGIRPRCSRPG